jgi:hypothetical protein
MLEQKVDEQAHSRRHCRAADEHRMNRFLIAGIPGFQ